MLLQSLPKQWRLQNLKASHPMLMDIAARCRESTQKVLNFIFYCVFAELKRLFIWDLLVK